ncbi:ribonuclease J [Pycnococcus provasolii]
MRATSSVNAPSSPRSVVVCSLPPPSKAGGRGGRAGGRGGRGGGRGGRGGGGGRSSGRNARGPRLFKKSSGTEHIGTSLRPSANAPFPGPKGFREGPPLRFLPLGGLGEIGMNCALLGHYDRYVLIDAGLMFPDFDEFGVQKVLPDTSFIHAWRDRIEALVITHGHEDHIGALPWVLPALDARTKIYCTGFTLELVKHRLREYGLWDESRFVRIDMGDRFACGPFEVEPVRVTHSIPDCAALVFRCDDGTVVHTGDWKIDENPVDGQELNRTRFEEISKEGVTMLMSDSTNVLAPGRSTSEADVTEALIRRISSHKSGRVIATQFASNVHRLSSMKQAADASGRQICFIGTSLYVYSEAAARAGQAPLDLDKLVPMERIDDVDPDRLLIVTTGSQGEERAQLTLAANDASNRLSLRPDDLVVYSAKMIPGNEKQVMDMVNRLSSRVGEVAMGRGERLHTSGHAYRDEQEEIINIIKPQHFLPIHGEYAFLRAHEQVARETGVQHTQVIRNGQMIGCSHLRNGNVVSSGFSLLGQANLRLFYNDGEQTTGDRQDMRIEERVSIAKEGIVCANVVYWPESEVIEDVEDEVAAREVFTGRLGCRVQLTTRALFADGGKLLVTVRSWISSAVNNLPSDSSEDEVKTVVTNAISSSVWKLLKKKPEIVVFSMPGSPRMEADDGSDLNFESIGTAAAGQGGGGRGGGRGRGGRGRGRGDRRAATRRGRGGGGGGGRGGGGGGDRKWPRRDRANRPDVEFP